jgi:putative membrane-bound dehydrogenase-like protein
MLHLRFFPIRWLRFAILFTLMGALPPGELFAVDIGVARIDVTPTDPIRLTGYGSRTTNSIGIEQKLWAKALAIGTDTEGPAVLMTLDNCGIAEQTYRELVQRLGRAGVRQDRVAIACSHTHTGPCTTLWAPNIFSRDISPDQQATIDRYTLELIDKLEQVARGALKDRRPGSLSWSQGNVSFARNRRVVAGNTARFGDNASGPVDHSLPVLKVEDPEGKIRALVVNYACHCTTLGGEFNRVCGDWAGYAQEYIERDHPGAVAFITIGCGADANPSPRGGADGGLALCKKHGEELAGEVKRLLSQTSVPLRGKLATRAKEIMLPFGPPFSRQQWEERAQKDGIVGYHAKKNLARLDRNEKMPTELYYPMVTWNFGDDLAFIFLPGEVVVDYALRLKQEFDSTRLWVTAYANYVPCYIPSRRILAEGGYEAEDSLWYYDRPARLSTNAEELIIKAVHELMPRQFLFEKKKAEFPNPKMPDEALATFRTKVDFTVELVATEPLIESPVAIDWDAQGRLWVCEMYDYPTGIDPLEDVGRNYGENPKAPSGGYKPGGRIKVLTDVDRDGHYDNATLFLDGLGFPTGVMPWRRGALICAAPDILYAEDTDGDGRADSVGTNFTGFATHNYQARVNGFTSGLDGWLYGSSGLFGGKIKSVLTGKTVDLSGRDFRIKPETGEIEPVAGISQMGRVRDDFDNWFGNDNSTLLWHYPLPDHYARRNLHVTYPDPRVNVAVGTGTTASQSFSDPNQLFPISHPLERFNDPDHANRVTGACGPCIYRDDLLGANYYGNVFICEPVHNLVTRRVLEPNGVTFTAHRAPDEERSEFFASTDNWFRPVQARTGPDGALWIVDMYRFVIEHPRWIPSNRLARLDVRAGADMGRIYRVYPRGAKLRPIRDLTKLKDSQLVQSMDTPNGPTRDLVHRELLTRAGGGITEFLNRAAGSHPPSVKVQILSLLAALNQTEGRTRIESFLRDDDPLVRREALRRLEPLLADSPRLPKSLKAMVQRDDRKVETDPMLEMDRRVRFQFALSLGASKAPESARLLARLALANEADDWLRSAVLSAAVANPGEILEAAYLVSSGGKPLPFAFLKGLTQTGVSAKDPHFIQTLARVMEVVPPGEKRFDRWVRPAAEVDRTAAILLDALDAKGVALDDFLRPRLLPSGELTRATIRLESEKAILRSAVTNRIQMARKYLAASFMSDARSPKGEDGIEAWVLLLGRERERLDEDLRVISDWLQPTVSPRLNAAAVDRLRRIDDRRVASMLLSNWQHYAPALRATLVLLLISRDEWVDTLLKAAQEGVIAANEIPIGSRQRLLQHSDLSLRKRTEKLFAANQTSRAEVLSKYQAVASLSAAPERGAPMFDQNCAQCHAFRGRGHPVGPNLAEFAGKSGEDFLVAILDPNSAINPNFRAYNIETKDGRSLTGIVKGETASSLILVQGGGLEEKILRSDIAEIRASQLSLMPEGLEQGISAQDMADLIAWLKQSAPALASVSAE